MSCAPLRGEVGYSRSMSPAQDLQRIANRLRLDVLEMVKTGGAGHIAGPLSSADLFALLYFGGIAHIDPRNPWDPERDRVVLSCGHYCPILYAALGRSGYFPVEKFVTFGQAGSELGVHPERRMGDNSLPGVEVSSGPLGQGVSVAAGMALALKIRYGERPHANTPKVFCILSDGEMEEGQVWEAFQFAVRRQLDNLIFILDRNRIQIERYVSEVVTYGNIAGRLEAFGLYVLETDGNDLVRLGSALDNAKKARGAPALIVMNTVAGKGVSFMENKPEWHDRVPTDEDIVQSKEELDATYV